MVDVLVGPAPAGQDVELIQLASSSRDRPANEHFESTAEVTDLGIESAAAESQSVAQATRTTAAGDDREEPPGSANDGQDPQHAHGWKLLAIVAALSLAVFLVALDQTIVATAIPQITDEFHSLGDVGWYGSSYLLTRAALQPSFGRVYSQFNVQYTFLLTIAVFELGSLVCGTAQSSDAFIVGRAIAGVGVGGLFTGSIMVVAHCAPLNRRPLMFGVIGSMWTIASVAGPLLGGAFTDELSWRWCFYINLPIGAFTIAVTTILIKPKKPPGSDELTLWQKIKKLDLLGALLTISATVCLILALQWGGSIYSWNDPTIIGLLAAAGCLSILLTYVQMRLGDKASLGQATTRWFTIWVYYQSIRGLSALTAGIRMLPLTISTSISASGTGALITAFGYYNPFMLLCMALFASGAGTLATLTVDTPYLRSLGFQILTGLGVGVGFETGIIVAQTVVPPASIPVAISIVAFALTIGGTIFLSISQAVFQYGLLQGLNKLAPQVDGHTLLNSGATNLYQLLASMGQQQLIEAVTQAYSDGTRNVFFVVMASAIAAFVAACGLRWKSIKKK